MVRLLVVTGIRFYREGLAAVLAGRSGIAACGAAHDAAEARGLIADDPPDVVLLDVALAGARELVTACAHPAGMRVVVMAVGEQNDELLEWAELGVAGYVGRDGSLEELCDTVEAAARGELRCSPAMASTLLRHLSTLAGIVRGARRQLPAVQLTAREHEIVVLIASGLSNKGIARRLGIEVATAKNHVHNILRKLQVEHRADAAAWLRLHPSSGDGPPAMDRRLILA
jgi:two-component system, NarL family, nitrate/nitrite response regulator NarL